MPTLNSDISLQKSKEYILSELDHFKKTGEAYNFEETFGEKE
jgi:hypothetical protein